MSFSEILSAIIIQPISRLIEICFLAFFEITNSAGLSIIGISFVVTLLCLPLYMTAEKWQEEERKIRIRSKRGITYRSLLGLRSFWRGSGPLCAPLCLFSYGVRMPIT